MRPIETPTFLPGGRQRLRVWFGIACCAALAQYWVVGPDLSTASAQTDIRNMVGYATLGALVLEPALFAFRATLTGLGIFALGRLAGGVVPVDLAIRAAVVAEAARSLVMVFALLAAVGMGTDFLGGTDGTSVTVALSAGGVLTWALALVSVLAGSMKLRNAELVTVVLGLALLRGTLVAIREIILV